VIESVPHEEHARGVEPDERRLELKMLGRCLCNKAQIFQAPRLASRNSATMRFRVFPYPRYPRQEDVLTP